MSKTRIAVLAFIATIGLVAFASAAVALSAPQPAISCDADTITFGESLTCETEGDVSALVWPGEVTTVPDSSHVPQAIGLHKVLAVDAAGRPLAAVGVTVTPDVRVECEEQDQEEPVYELVHTDLRPEGWDYVYVDPATDIRILPGDPDHPAQAAFEPLERIEVDRVRVTGLCRLKSDALDLFDGSKTLTLESEWEPPLTTPVGIIGPASKTHWTGAQPGTVTGTVTIDGITVSERVGVYFAGCT